MCGWIAVLGKPVTQESILGATELMASRGPDGSGIRMLTGPSVVGSLGHRRLAILDVTAAGAQPMHDPDTGRTIVYNGEVYNSPALRRELIQRGHRFRSASDTEVILRGWLEWGNQVLDRIEGIFSLCLVNEKTGEVLLARDRLGVKPLYWTYDDGCLIAGSAPRSLLHIQPQLRRKVDRVAIAEFLALAWIPHPRTPWVGIKKLEPGSAISLVDGALRKWSYWKPPAQDDSALDPADLRGALENATDRQLLSDVPVGLLFSGGLDSSLLLEFMVQRYGTEKLEALTASYDPDAQKLEIAPDDLLYARRAAEQHESVVLHPVSLGQDADTDVDLLAFHFDDPVADPAAISLYRLVASSSCKVLLSGVGGEELFAGYPRHQGLGLARRAAVAPSLARRLGGRAGRLLMGGRPGPLYGARRNAQKLSRAIGDRTPPHYWRMMSQFTFDELNGLLPDAAPAAWDELDSLSAPLSECTLDDALSFDRDQFLPNLNLAYVDKASMAVGVEVRVPFLDESVVDRAFAASVQGLIQNGVTKAPLKRAARGVVMDTIIDRPKSGFGGPARSWFRGASGSTLPDRIASVADAGLVDRNAAIQISRAASVGSFDAALSAWALVCLHAWYVAHGSA